MGIISGVFFILAGLIYIAYQAHKEYPGGLLFVLVMCAEMVVVIYVIPRAICFIYTDVNRTLGTVLLVLYGIAFISGAIYWICIAPDRVARKEAEESARIWKEVDELPEPDTATLLNYRELLHLPTYPVDNKVYNDAARNAWRTEQYNIRYKKKHKFVVYL